MKYLKLFETHAEYEESRQNLILPNVSLCAQENEVHYNKSKETRVVAVFNVTDTSQPTPIGYSQYISAFTEIEIDGVAQPTVVSAYTFDTVGEHTVKYALLDPTSIDEQAFANCPSLTNIAIPNNVTSIGLAAFSNCSGLTSVIIPNSVTSIGQAVFFKCTSLTNVEIGSGVTSIGSQLFQDCINLSTITSHIMNAPIAYSGSFHNVKNGGTLYVPIGSSGYETWMSDQGNLGQYDWTKVEQ